MEKNKFRFWHKRNKQFIENHSVKFKKDGSISNQYGAIEISQCSGLKDGKGNLIFEGDIVLDFRKHSSVLQFWHCRFANGSFSFFNGNSIMKNVDTTKFEVMGNIYQNKEKHKDINYYINF